MKNQDSTAISLPHNMSEKVIQKNNFSNDKSIKTEALAPEANAHILIIEDDMLYEPIWKHIIEVVHPQAQVVWATNGSQAEEILSKSSREGSYFHLIIADIFLSGGKTGLDLWYKYGESSENMIIVSGVEYNKLINYLGPEKNPPLFLKKPLQINECIELVGQILKINE